MAHHNSTPISVLDAPTLTREVVSPQRGYSRSERRHGVYSPPGMSKEAREVAAQEASEAGRNTPATTDRVRKIRKGRKARFNRGEA